MSSIQAILVYSAGIPELPKRCTRSKIKKNFKRQQQQQILGECSVSSSYYFSWSLLCDVSVCTVFPVVGKGYVQLKILVVLTIQGTANY